MGICPASRRRGLDVLVPRAPGVLKPIAEILEVGGSQWWACVAVDRVYVRQHGLGELAQAPDRLEAGRGLRDGERIDPGRRQPGDDPGRGDVALESLANEIPLQPLNSTSR